MNISKGEVMTKEELQAMTKEQVFDFIREKLSFDKNIVNQLRVVDKAVFQKEHRRFEMSGYEDTVGECTKFNLAILNEFADVGIYDYTSYLFLDFYKGNGTLYFQYFGESENQEIELSGYTTTQIIYAIFENTILSGKKTRRRN